MAQKRRSFTTRETRATLRSTIRQPSFTPSWSPSSSPGNIKNAVLRAAFIAAERGTNIDHEALELAVVREVEEIGKLVRSDA